MSSTKQSQLPGTLPDEDTNATDDVSKNLRRAELPAFINEFSEDLLRELAEELGWNIKDVSEEVNDHFGDVKARFEHFDIEPDPRGSPTENGAGKLWKNDPEHFEHWGGSE